VNTVNRQAQDETAPHGDPAHLPTQENQGPRDNLSRQESRTAQSMHSNAQQPVNTATANASNSQQHYNMLPSDQQQALHDLSIAANGR
jgi:hypothetical protein